MNCKNLKSFLALGVLVAASAAHAGGNISALTATATKVKVGQAVSITVGGTLDDGSKCHIAGGDAKYSPNFKDLGLISSFPYTLPNFQFDSPGVHYFHVYVGSADKENFCTQSGPGSIRFEVEPQDVAAPSQPLGLSGKPIGRPVIQAPILVAPAPKFPK